jgi:hypothetical protein
MMFKKDKLEEREFEKVDTYIHCQLRIYMVNNKSSLILGRHIPSSCQFHIKAKVRNKNYYPSGDALAITPLRMNSFISDELFSERSYFHKLFRALDGGDKTYAFNRNEFDFAYWQGTDYYYTYTDYNSYSTTLNLCNVLYTEPSYSISFSSDELDSFGTGSNLIIPNEFIEANNNQDQSLKVNLDEFYFDAI